MGYYVAIEIEGVRIAADKVEDCLKAINALHEPDLMEAQANGGSYSGGKVTDRWYSWVDNPPAGGFKDLPAAFKDWRYSVSTLPSGRVVLEEFSGEKWGDDEILFQAIAPFVEGGGTIEITGEEGEKWRFLFDGEGVIEQTATITWTD